MSDPHDPTPSPQQKAVRDLYANSGDSTALIAKFRDQVNDLAEHFKSYQSLERFVAPGYADEDADEDASNARAELRAMLITLNGHMQRQIDALTARAIALQALTRKS